MNLFNKVTLHTPESVDIELCLAGIGNRALALLIDYFLIAVGWTIFQFMWAIFSYLLIDSLGNALDITNTLRLWLQAILIIIVFVFYQGYFVIFETVWQGKTPGKRFAKIQVIRDDGRPIGLQQAALRALVKPLDDTLFLGAILIFFNQREKRLGDFAAGTLVVQTQKPVQSSSEIKLIDESAKDLANWLNQNTDISKILPDDFAIICEYLQRRTHMSMKARGSLSYRLGKQVQGIINLENIPESKSYDIFLEAVYLAYKNQSPT
ncbi:MAG: RDD family protein [Cyanobacteria bacterium P01_A01_bin.45]